MIEPAPQAGAADPRRRNSPIQADAGRSFELLREQVGDEAAGCWFDGVRYPQDAQFAGGNTRLRCEPGPGGEAGETRAWREEAAATGPDGG